MLTASLAIGVSGISGAAVSERSDLAFVGGNTVSGSQGLIEVQAFRSETCRSAHNGLRWYRARQREWSQLHPHASWPRGRQPRSCADARYLARVARIRAHVSRVTYERYVAAHTLRDPEVRPGNDAWEKAVQRVQRVFPGTASWLWSCSAAEGDHGRWVVHGGGDYYPGAEDGAEVGGWMQYTYDTFSGHFRRGVEYVRSKGFRVPAHLRRSSVAAWRSALAQAIAAGWARWSGNDDSHWSASFGMGC